MSAKHAAQPLVTVYIPTHNRSSLVKRAIASVQNQTYRNLEIIICDDGSSDDTEVVIAKMKEQDSRIIYLKNDRPMGACHARNRCIAIAKGEFITGLDDDDYFLNTRIANFVTASQKLNKPFLCANMIFKNRNIEKKWKSYVGDITLNMMGFKNWVGNQVFIRTSMMKNIGGFDINFPAWQDYDLWYRMIMQYGSCYRIDDASYVVNIDDDRPRITTGSKAWQGYQKFITTHKPSLSRQHLKSLYFQDKLNRKDEINFKEFFHYPSIDNLLILTKHKVRKLISNQQQ
ncbi:glycosyltransferase [Pantoea sp. At-9b]|uniref:glycosyltransferase n=1 Tax=Pantoea sp. (strain At-9b) TaxID=592316 RepID=UPI0001B3DF68|nr:glycosyltransferase [Pantoea sp. At-9b]ADU67663.1 glycosyl transferase family 2 [Pantoea sp. At-9b]